MDIRLPKDYTLLDKIFRKADVPDVTEFDGEYAVEMLTGLPSIKALNHRKIFYQDQNMVVGHNVFFKKRTWGHFFLKVGIFRNFDDREMVIINYERPQNSFMSSKIVDYVRCIEKGRLYLARFNYRFVYKLRFVGYFSLTKSA